MEALRRLNSGQRWKLQPETDVEDAASSRFIPFIRTHTRESRRTYVHKYTVGPRSTFPRTEMMRFV